MSDYLLRLRQGRYHSPSGQVFEFECDDVVRNSGKKTSEYDYPFYNGGDIADLGITIPTHPLTIYFKGNDYDIIADRFWRALWEEGEGLLEHPRFGNITVIPTSFEQSEALVRGMGRAVFSVTFKEVSTPIAETTIKSEQRFLQNRINDSLSALPGSLLDIAAGSLASFKRKVFEGLNFVNSQISKFYDVTAEFNSLFVAFEINFDGLLNTPQAFVTALYSLYRLPGQSVLNMRDKIKLYRDFITDINAAGFTDDPFSGLTADERKGLYLSMYIGTLSYAEAAVSGLPADRRDAIEGLNAFLHSYRRYSSVVSSLESTGNRMVIASPEFEQNLKDVFSKVSALILVTIDSLNRIGIKKLDNTMTPIDVVFSQYGALDRLDEFIAVNALRGDEIFMLNKGRKVLFYE
jgi:hypothetical protein